MEDVGLCLARVTRSDPVPVPPSSSSHSTTANLASPHYRRSSTASKQANQVTLNRCMHIAPSSNSPKKSLKQKQSKLPPQSNSQHGFPLLSPDYPPEALNWTTSFLIPEDLFTLSSVSKRLHAHVALDATWRSAFLRYTFGLDPETNFGREKQLLLKRTCSTWKEEYVLRFHTIR